jgi:site-specific recombinase XerD
MRRKLSFRRSWLTPARMPCGGSWNSSPQRFATRTPDVAYYNDVRQFFAWCERRGIDGLKRIEPIHVALYVEELQHSFSKPTVKQHLAAVRMLFDWLVTGQVTRTNPRMRYAGQSMWCPAARRPCS